MMNTDKNRTGITRRIFLKITATSMLLALAGKETIISAFIGLNDVSSSSSGNVVTAWTSWPWSQTNRSQLDAGILSQVETATSAGNVKLAMLASDFYTSGTISSQVYDSEASGTRWDALIWDEEPVANTDITFQVRASDTLFTKDAVSPSWSNIFASSPVQAGMPSGRYMQWRATLTTSDVASTPTLKEVRVYYSGPLTSGKTQVTDIGATSGTVEVGQSLTAGALTPEAATASYQWQKSLTTGGTFPNITGATSNNYTLIMADLDRYVRVMATGTGDYKGSVASAYVGPVKCQITDIGAITGTAEVAKTLTAGELTPATATAHYQWKKCLTVDGEYSEITGATSNTYVVTADDYLNYGYIKVSATGHGSYTGTVTSAATPQIAQGQITSISPIIGTAASGQTLTAGMVYPVGATVSYQWQRLDGASFIDIDGATSNTYLLSGADINKYIRIVVTGTGSYTGTANATTSDPVTSSATPITAIDTIGGTAQVGHTLTAGALTPAGATATYQWRSCATSDGTYEDIEDEVLDEYTITSALYTKYIKVVATASGSYSGEVTSAYIGPVGKGEITAIAPISGTTVVGEILTAGVLTPASATANYQWQSLNGETWVDISGATSNTYQLDEEDYGKYIKVVATGSGYFTGTVSVTTVSTVTTTLIPLTAIGTISGTAQVNSTLTAGALTPSGATASYQWQRCSTVDGTYENISGATSNTYVVTALDYTNYGYIKVKATGSGTYSETVYSAAKGPVVAGIFTMAAIVGTTQPGQTLTAGSLTPSGATVTYQWYLSNWAGDVWTLIPGATSNTYTVQGADSGGKLKVTATGTGAYIGCSDTKVTLGRVVNKTTPITAIGNISGTAQVAQTLTAGAITPSGASVTYQWQRCATSDGTYSNISGATSNTYVVTALDYTNYGYIKVKATGSVEFSGTVTSNYVGPVASCPVTAIGAISGTAVVENTLTVGTITPLSATVTYQWQRCLTSDGEYTSVSGATSSTYTMLTGDIDYYFKVSVTGTTGYSGTVTSEYTGPVASISTPLESIGDISGTAQVEQTLTAGTLTPEGATATYQWYNCATSDGDYDIISGATSSTYTLTASDYTKYIKVVAIGSGSYSGTVTSAAKGPVTECPITAMAAIIGEPLVGDTIYAGSLTPSGAAGYVTYQWQHSNYVQTPTEEDWVNLTGATTNSYLVSSVYNYCYLRVVATGTGPYAGVMKVATPTRVRKK